MVNNKSTLSKTTLSLNNSCAILGISKPYVKSQPIFREAMEHGYLLFKLKSLKFSEPSRSYFVVSNQCLEFIISELEQQQDYFEVIDYLQNFNIIYPRVSLIKITNGRMSEKREIINAISILKEKEIYPIAHKLFVYSYGLVVNVSDSEKALCHLHDELIHFNKTTLEQVG